MHHGATLILLREFEGIFEPVEIDRL